MGHRRYTFFCWFAVLLLLLVGVSLLLIGIGTQDDGGDGSSNTVSKCSTLTGTQLPASLDAMRDALLQACDAQGSVPWATYAANPTHHRGKNVLVRDHDVKSGTLRIVQPACIRVVEDLVIDFRAQHDYRVDPVAQPQYAARAFSLGFFAGFSVETSRWVIDLGGHTVVQSRAFYLQQRFYAHVELADRPFVDGQGPGDFGEHGAAAASEGVLMNGHFGLSSHHAVHGNGAHHVLFEKLTLDTYDVAGVSLNDGHAIVLRQVEMRGTATPGHVLVNAFYSHARFLMPFIDAALASRRHQVARQQLMEARRVLQEVMDDAFHDLVTRRRKTIDRATHPAAYALFHNEGGLIDGNAYGLLLHSRGVAVNGFRNGPSNTPSNVLVDRCIIAQTRAKVVEVVALQQVRRRAGGSATHVTGPAGDVLRVASIANHSLDGRYVGDALSDAQIALARWVHAQTGLTAAERRRFVGTLRINEAVVQWADHAVTLGHLVRSGQFIYRRNGDSMFHVNKGVVGIRLDAGHDICVRDTVVAVTTNTGLPGHFLPLAGEDPSHPVFYDGIHDVHGHPGQAPQQGYMGADCRGISVAASVGVVFKNVTVDGVRSRWGQACAADMFNGAEKCHLVGGTLHDVTSMDRMLHMTTPTNRPGHSVGVRVTQSTSHVMHHGVDIYNISSGAIGCAYARLLDVDD